MLKNSLCQPSLSFSFNAAPLFLFLFPDQPPLFFLFLFPRQPPLFFLLFSSNAPFLLFWCVALYFSAQNTFFSAQTFFNLKTLFSAQNVFASAQNFFQFSHSSISALLFVLKQKENKIKDNFRHYQLDPIEKYHDSPSHDLNLDFITSDLLF